MIIMMISDDWVIEGNKWIMPWYNSHIKKRERLRNERGWSEDEIDLFHKNINKQTQDGKNFSTHYFQDIKLRHKCYLTDTTCL